MKLRNQRGWLSSKPIKVLALVIVSAAIGFTGSFAVRASGPELVYAATSTPAVSELQGLSAVQLEDKLDAIIWKGESRTKTMQAGETYMTFDPPQSWIRDGSVATKCFKVGGKMNLECNSFGPRQEKIPTIISYWPQLHNGATITELDARTVAEGNDSSQRFFLDCAESIKGCVKNWTTATDDNGNTLPNVQLLLDLIREAKGINLQ